MRYSFDMPSAPSARKTQFYSMLGSRGIWHEGWKAVTTHPTVSGWGHFNDDTWELYHTDVDRAELRDLAAEQPDKLRELISLWFAEAGANGAFPLDDRSALEIITTPRPLLSGPREPLHVLPRCGRRARGAGRQHPEPVVLDRGARRHPGSGTSRGRAVRARRQVRRARLYVKDGRLHYVYNFVGLAEQKIDGTEHGPGRDERDPRPPRSTRTARTAPGVATGILSLYHGDQKVGEGRIRTQPGNFSLAGEGLCIGRDSGEAVTDDYSGEPPYRFTGGTIKRVAVDVSGDPYVDLEREAVAMLARE